MSKAFVLYWNPWMPTQPGERLARTYALSRGRISPGDRVFVTRVKDGTPYLLGAFTVASVEAGITGTPDELIAEPDTGTPLADRPIPNPLAERLRLASDDPAPDTAPLEVTSYRALRRPRQLDSESAAALEALLGSGLGFGTAPEDGADESNHAGTADQCPLYNDKGELVRATFSVASSGDAFEVVLGSRGGTLGTANAVNPEYSKGLRVILSRIGRLHGAVTDALVASRELIRRGLGPEQRRVDGLQWPAHLTPTTDFESLASKLQRGQINVGSTGTSGKGNSTRRLLLRVLADGFTIEQFTKFLASGAQQDQPLPLGAVPLVPGNAADSFDPDDILDARRRVERSLMQRQGQPAFRQRLLAAYQHRCAITRCDVPEILEAAHIVPYWGPQTNHVQNGLLLRADLHTLFDRGLFGIDATGQVRLAERLKQSAYGFLDGAVLQLPTLPQDHPSPAALQRHLDSISDSLG
jgi:putative restriction endonuclease